MYTVKNRTLANERHAGHPLDHVTKFSSRISERHVAAVNARKTHTMYYTKSGSTYETGSVSSPFKIRTRECRRKGPIAKDTHGFLLDCLVTRSTCVFITIIILISLFSAGLYHLATLQYPGAFYYINHLVVFVVKNQLKMFKRKMLLVFIQFQATHFKLRSFIINE